MFKDQICSSWISQFDHKTSWRNKIYLSVFGLYLFFLCRLKRRWIMTPTTQMMKFPQWRGDHCLAAGRGREPSLWRTEKRVCVCVCCVYPQGLCIHSFNQTICFSESGFLSLFFAWSSSRGLDLAFKTPIRPIMRHERILSEINPSPPCNSTSRKIYSPIVRFLTPSKESECSYCYWKT